MQVKIWNRSQHPPRNPIRPPSLSSSHAREPNLRLSPLEQFGGSRRHEGALLSRLLSSLPSSCGQQQSLAALALDSNN